MAAYCECPAWATPPHPTSAKCDQLARFTHTPQVLIVDLCETRYTNASELEPAACQVAALDRNGRPWVFRFYGDCGLDHAIDPAGNRHDVYEPYGDTPRNVPPDLWRSVMSALDIDSDPLPVTV